MRNKIAYVFVIIIILRKSTLFLTGVTLNSVTTDNKPLAGFQMELVFRNVGFCGGRRTGVPVTKLSEQG